MVYKPVGILLFSSCVRESSEIPLLSFVSVSSLPENPLWTEGTHFSWPFGILYLSFLLGIEESKCV